MDPADIDSIRGALAAQGTRVAEHSEALRDAMEAFKNLATRVPDGCRLDLLAPHMRKVFDHPVEGGDAAKRLISLHQGSRSIADFSLEFRTSDKSLRGLILSGLSESIKDELATREEADTLDEIISLSIRLDNRLRERRREETGSFVPPALAAFCSPHLPRAALSAPMTRAVTEEEPMQLGRTRLTQAERLHRIRNRLCLYCALPGHLISTCPSLP